METSSMSIVISNIKLPVEEDFDSLPACIARQFDLPQDAVRAVRVLRRSLDARKKREIGFRVSAVVQLSGPWEQRLLKASPDCVPYAPPGEYVLPECKGERERIAIVGLGPAGLFAGYFLARHGYAPLILERGRMIDERVADVELFWGQGALDPESNVMFGEGGAGTFSDGKLTARSKDPRADVVLATLARFGAPAEILIDAKPHIGTDLLRDVVRGMRREIQRLGGEVLFSAKMTGLDIQDGRLRGLTVERNGETERIACGDCILAIGQGARDTYRMLAESGVAMAPKAFAVGVRVEHPQSMIDRAQLGEYAGHPNLGAAEYRLRAQSGGRGVYSFCMCPGGEVVASSSGPNQVVTNGMSRHARDGENANAALVVQVAPKDFGEGPLDGMVFQEKLEEAAFRAGGGNFTAPAQRMEDFLQNRATKGFGDVKPSYRPGVTGARLSDVLPDFVSAGLRDGLTAFGRQIKGFTMPDAVLTAVESRTSAPVRILRGETGEALGIAGLYPVGEGAGYAGGIVSAAIDGMKAAERIANA